MGKLKKLKVLDIGHTYNKKLLVEKKDFPKNLRILITGQFFNQDLNDFLEKSEKLKVLELGYAFNQKINKLPETIKSLVLSDKNQLSLFGEKISEKIKIKIK